MRKIDGFGMFRHEAARSDAHQAWLAPVPIAVGTRLDGCGALACPHVNHRRRNEVAFDALPAPTAALNSPTRHALRADYPTYRNVTGAHTAIAGPPRFAREAAANQRGS